MTIDDQIKKIEERIRKLFDQRRKLKRINFNRCVYDRIDDWQKKLRSFVDQSKYKHYEVAEKIGVQKQSFSRWVNLEKRIPKRRADQIIKLLNIESY